MKKGEKLRNTMISVFLACVVVMGFCGCAKKERTKGTKETISASSNTTEPSVRESVATTNGEDETTRPATEQSAASSAVTEPQSNKQEGSSTSTSVPSQPTEATSSQSQLDTSNSIAHVHSYTTTVVNPTCTEKGYTLHACACGSSYKTNETSVTGNSHLYGNWETVVRPTATSEGKKQCACTRCGYILSEVVPKLPSETVELYEKYIDPRIEVEYYNEAVSYRYGIVAVTDTRSWGDPPNISITETGGFTVIYCKQDGTKVTIPVVPLEGYINRCVLLGDGSYTIRPIGDYKD